MNPYFAAAVIACAYALIRIYAWVAMRDAVKRREQRRDDTLAVAEAVGVVRTAPLLDSIADVQVAEVLAEAESIARAAAL